MGKGGKELTDRQELMIKSTKRGRPWTRLTLGWHRPGPGEGRCPVADLRNCHNLGKHKAPGQCPEVSLCPFLSGPSLLPPITLRPISWALHTQGSNMIDQALHQGHVPPSSPSPEPLSPPWGLIPRAVVLRDLWSLSTRCTATVDMD